MYRRTEQSGRTCFEMEGLFDAVLQVPQTVFRLEELPGLHSISRQGGPQESVPNPRKYRVDGDGGLDPAGSLSIDGYT
jgi:hypothetical protein